MTSLSQYPAEETTAQEVVLHSSTSVSLKVAALFVHLEEVKHRGPDNMSLLVPMTLPTSCRDVSLGMAAEAARHDIENGHIHLPGGTQPTFLVASRNGYAQHNPETRLPAGFVASVMNLVNDKSTDATLLTPACRMFSKMAKTNNLRARPLLLHDMDGMRDVIDKKCLQVGSTLRGIELDSGNPSMGALQGFVELLLLLQRLVDNGTTMEEAYNSMAEGNPDAASRFKSSEACRQLNLQLAECDDEDATEQCHWLALSLLLQHVSPVFLSPISAAHKCMAAILSNSSLSTRVGDYPFLCVMGGAVRRQRSSLPNAVGAVRLLRLTTTTVFAPAEASAEGLDAAVRYLYQKSLNLAETVGTVDGQFEDMHRILDLLRVCQIRGEGFTDVAGLTQSLMREQAPNTRGCYEKRLKTLMSMLHQRRPGLFLLVLKYLGLRSTWRGGTHLPRQTVIDRIAGLLPDGSSVESKLKLVLTPPGTDPSSQWDEETKTVQPIHDLEYFRPSAQHLASDQAFEEEAYAPTQQSQEEETEHEKESIRITLFSDAWLKSTWFFLDCIVQTSHHAKRLSAMITRQYQRHDDNMPLWCPRVMNDFVQMFWMTSYFINSHVRQMSTLVENRLEREEAKSIVKGIFHAMLPYMLVELVEKHGMTNKATEGFRSMIKKFPSNSQFERIEVFGIASLAMYQRSKTPSIVGGSDFHDEIVAPKIKVFLLNVLEITGAEKVGKSAAENARDVAGALKQMEMGKLVIPNIVVDLYSIALKELPASVDRVRHGVTEPTMAGQKATSKRRATAKAACDGSVMEETSTGQRRTVPAEADDGEGDTTESRQGSSTELINRIHSFLNTLLDDRFQYSPRTVLLQIAMLTKYEEVDELRNLFKRCGMDTQSQDETSSEDEAGQHDRTPSYRRSLVVQEGAREESASEADEEEQEMEKEQEDFEEEEELGQEPELEVTKKEGGEESSSKGSSSSDEDVTLRSLMVPQRGQSEANRNARRTCMLPKRQREVDSLGAEATFGSSEDEEVMIAKKRVHGRKRRVIRESDSESDGS